jgi:hypothetical protein
MPALITPAMTTALPGSATAELVAVLAALILAGT